MFEKLEELSAKKFALLLYGVEGVGKTTAATCTPKPVFITAKKEHGICLLYTSPSPRD